MKAIDSKISVLILEMLQSPNEVTSSIFMELYNKVYDECTNTKPVYEIKGRAVYDALHKTIDGFTSKVTHSNTLVFLYKTLTSLNSSTSLLCGVFNYLERFFIKTCLDRRDSHVMDIKSLINISMYENYIHKTEKVIFELLVCEIELLTKEDLDKIKMIKKIIKHLKTIFFSNERETVFKGFIKQYFFHASSSLDKKADLDIICVCIYRKLKLASKLFEPYFMRSLKKNFMGLLYKRRVEVLDLLFMKLKTGGDIRFLYATIASFDMLEDFYERFRTFTKEKIYMVNLLSNNCIGINNKKNEECEGNNKSNYINRFNEEAITTEFCANTESFDILSIENASTKTLSVQIITTMKEFLIIYQQMKNLIADSLECDTICKNILKDEVKSHCSNEFVLHVLSFLDIIILRPDSLSLLECIVDIINICDHCNNIEEEMKTNLENRLIFHDFNARNEKYVAEEIINVKYINYYSKYRCCIKDVMHKMMIHNKDSLIKNIHIDEEMLIKYQELPMDGLKRPKNGNILIDRTVRECICKLDVKMDNEGLSLPSLLDCLHPSFILKCRFLIQGFWNIKGITLRKNKIIEFIDDVIISNSSNLTKTYNLNFDSYTSFMIIEINSSIIKLSLASYLLLDFIITTKNVSTEVIDNYFNCNCVKLLEQLLKNNIIVNRSGFLFYNGEFECEYLDIFVRRAQEEIAVISIPEQILNKLYHTQAKIMKILKKKKVFERVNFQALTNIKDNILYSKALHELIVKDFIEERNGVLFYLA